MIDIKSWADNNNYKIAWGSINCILESYKEFAAMSKLGELSNVQDYVFKKWGTFENIKETGMNTVILIAADTSKDARRIILDCAGKEAEVLLPPCYSDNSSKTFDENVEKSISEFVNSYGYKIEKFTGPYKYLSEKLGLGKYGRNNLLYVDDFGSYIRLIGFVTNAEFESEFSPKKEPYKSTLENCEKCDACKKSCPTNAIADDRFRLHADRCLSDYSESTGEWPEFVKNAKNKCLVGCLSCQLVCPYNKKLIDSAIVLQERFSQDEVNYILGEPVINMSDVAMTIEYKIKKLGLASHKDYIIRNLRSIMKNYYNF